MENKEIVTIGKFFFWLSFILGNICLFGYLITKIEDFALSGFMLLQVAAPLNLIVILCLVIYGLINKPQLKIFMNASLIICINIPVSILYFFIGTSII